MFSSSPKTCCASKPVIRRHLAAKGAKKYKKTGNSELIFGASRLNDFHSESFGNDSCDLNHRVGCLSSPQLGTM
jgi:hypothetical protein